jgi:hypothetical protein
VELVALKTFARSPTRSLDDIDRFHVTTYLLETRRPSQVLG